MSEQIQPCPVCKKQTGQPTSRAMWGARGHDAYMCYECGLELPMAVWNELSDAVQLKRAVEEINAKLHSEMNKDEEWRYSLNVFPENLFEGHTTIETLIDGECAGSVTASSLAAALIALAGEGNSNG